MRFFNKVKCFFVKIGNCRKLVLAREGSQFFCFAKKLKNSRLMGVGRKLSLAL